MLHPLITDQISKLQSLLTWTDVAVGIDIGHEHIHLIKLRKYVTDFRVLETKSINGTPEVLNTFWGSEEWDKFCKGAHYYSLIIPTDRTLIKVAQHHELPENIGEIEQPDWLAHLPPGIDAESVVIRQMSFGEDPETLLLCLIHKEDLDGFSAIYKDLQAPLIIPRLIALSNYRLHVDPSVAEVCSRENDQEYVLGLQDKHPHTFEIRSDPEAAISNGDQEAPRVSRIDHVGSKSSLQQLEDCYQAAAGAAMSSFKHSGSNFDFSQGESKAFRRQLRIKHISYKLILLSGVLTFFIMGLTMLSDLWLTHKYEELRLQQIAFAPQRQQLQALKADSSKLGNQINRLRQLRRSGSHHSLILLTAAECTKGSLWFTKLVIEAGENPADKCYLEALGRTEESISAFLNRLEAAEGISEVRLDKMGDLQHVKAAIGRQYRRFNDHSYVTVSFYAR